jgi:hypothetical protein
MWVGSDSVVGRVGNQGDNLRPIANRPVPRMLFKSSRDILLRPKAD